MISIIIPIYNAESYLCECLNSIKNQTFIDYEVICVDDGSSDKSKEICESFVSEDKRFFLLSKTNGGVSSARNLALEKTKGDYVCFVDSDDVVADDFLEHLVFLSKGGDFAICDYTRELEELGTGQKTIERYDAINYIKHVINETVKHPNICMMLFKTKIIKEQKINFTLGCIRNEDYEFYMKYMSQEKTVMVSNYKAYYYRKNENSASHKYDSSILTAIEAESRISDYLIKKGIINENNLMLPSSVQYFVYYTTRYKFLNVYNLIHEIYDVRCMMKKMIKHPRLSRKVVALTYCLFGKKYFYILFGKI